MENCTVKNLRKNTKNCAATTETKARTQVKHQNIKRISTSTKFKDNNKFNLQKFASAPYQGPSLPVPYKCLNI